MALGAFTIWWGVAHGVVTTAITEFGRASQVETNLDWGQIIIGATITVGSLIGLSGWQLAERKPREAGGLLSLAPC
jgi:hypothetical protein